MELIGEVEPFEGARELIEDLRLREHPVVLASSAKSEEVEHYLDLLDARELADGWTTSADVEKTKPNPDLVCAALEKAETEDAVMIGDTPWDVKAAKAVGVETITVLTGGFSEQELTDAGAIAVYESVAALRDGPRPDAARRLGAIGIGRAQAADRQDGARLRARRGGRDAVVAQRERRARAARRRGRRAAALGAARGRRVADPRHRRRGRAARACCASSAARSPSWRSSGSPASGSSTRPTSSRSSGFRSASR